MDALELRGMLWRAMNDLQHLENVGPRTKFSADQSTEMSLAAGCIQRAAKEIRDGVEMVDKSQELADIKKRIKG